MTDPAELIITNARAYTVDAARPWAEAVAIRGNRIVFVGDASAALALRGANTEVIDGEQRTLLPGLIDSHFHLLWGSLKLDSLQLDEARGLGQIATAVKTYADAQPDLEWIQGFQLFYSAIPTGQSLTRQLLDAAVPDRPVLIIAFDGHTAWANTEALRRGGILDGRSTAAGSEIVMDQTLGLATGELREPAAYSFVRDLIPEPDAAAQRTLLGKGLARAASFGLTSVHNMDGTAERIGLYKEFEERGDLTLRVYVPYDIKPETPLAAFEDAATWPCFLWAATSVRARSSSSWMACWNRIRR